MNYTYQNPSHNFLTGVEQLPWKNLKLLDLHSNMLEVALPIPPLATTFFFISNNRLTGEIPSLICNVSSLEIINLSNNSFSGVIPQCLGTFAKNLSVLDLRMNSFHGTTPKTFAKGNALGSLNFSGNKLEGLVTNSLVNCTKLEVLDLINNNINDTFHGPISDSKANHSFPKLQIIDFSNNDFSGSLTTRFQGEIPKSIEKLTSLIVLNLSHNSLTGHIPTSLGSLRELELLDLSSNNLTGEILVQLTSLTFLVFLNLSQNQFEGSIPQGPQFDTFQNNSYLENLAWCGFPLTKKCSADEAPQPPPLIFQKEDNQGSASGFEWKAVFMGQRPYKTLLFINVHIIENGENWSMGQRQLVCLGRVLLKKSKVLVLDEATASVDTATDNLIQQTLRQHFTDSTVITIAHRITSVLDSDMVLLLDHDISQKPENSTKMEVFQSQKQAVLTSLSHSPALTLAGWDFLLKPKFLHAISGSLHLVLLLVLFISWVCKIIGMVSHRENSKQRSENTRIAYYKQTLFCSLGLLSFHLVLCFLHNMYWYRNEYWSDEIIVTLLDLVVRPLAWLAISVYLYTQVSNSGETKFPFLLRIWWGFYLFISSYSVVIDFVLAIKDQSFPIEFVVSDVVSVILGLFFCYVGFSGKNEGVETLFQEPLLNDDANTDNGAESNKSKGGETVTPFLSASIFSILTFSWMSPLISVGNKKTLDLEDVPQLADGDSVVGAFPIFRNKLESDSSRGSGISAIKLVKALILSAWREILLTALFALLYTLASFVGPYLIKTFVQYLNGRREFKNEGYILVFTFLVAKLIECLSQRHLFFRLQQVGIRVRALLVAMIYNKGLTLSCQSKQGHTTGEIINFMTVDAERVGEFIYYVHQPWLIIVQITFALLILYTNLGLASIVTLVATALFMLANAPLGILQERFQKKLMESKDTRMKATSEILKNMRILKLQGWEMKFLSKIVEIRKIEAGLLKKFSYTFAVTIFVFWGAPTFVSVVTFGACMIMGIQLDSGKILSALATFKILQQPIYSLPDTISMIVQTKVSLDRIASFLQLDDLQPNVIEKLPRGSSDTAIEIVDGNFSWDLSSPNMNLTDINFKVCHGMRVAVCGTVGSGKSSLLSCILGEVPKISGIIKVSGTKAYVAQSPWIQSGTIEENILFCKEMDRERYERVLEACSLKKDLEVFSFGDQTVIGERGINLSGGQKQRIQIARALYQEADIYLFDDPFSAVDAHTGTHLFKECLLGLLGCKTVIYVTHQVEFLPAADLILVMKDGRITQAGKYHDILNSGTDFMELVGAHKKALLALDCLEAHSEQLSISEEDGDKSITNEVEQKEENINVQKGKVDDIVWPKGQLVQEEEREKGKVGFSVYWNYITTAYGGALVPFILLAMGLSQLLQVGSSYWMAWATPVSEDVEANVEGSTLIIVYVALAMGSSFCILATTTLLVTAGYKTATILFNRMHLCIFRAPMSFFDATPSGRILNRGSTDQSALDVDIPFLFGSFATSMIQLLGIILVMSQAAWQVFIIFIPVIATCVWYQRYYIPSARELSRLVGVCKAPAIQHFAETISGSATIRSFDKESRFRDTNMKLVDEYSRPKFHIAGAMEWLCFRLDLLSHITFAFSLVLLISVPEGLIDPVIAGLAVTYGLNLNMLQANTIWNLCYLENKIISVERILQYTCIPSEPPLVIEESRPDRSWPSHGEVNIHDLQVRYAPHLPLVLRGLTCTFLGGMKTGIVGRTGSGKSTLIQTFFRIVEPDAGQIMIDGINISSIGLHDLRSRLSVIPQDPTMFEGTVRSNLDPLIEYTDEQIWEALDKCQLGDEIRKKEGKLDSTVVENGENWSMGQRQLVCLGRVLLKKSKVLVLDEATASVDTATDNLIQQTLRQHFTDSTVITIAHRITSVLDSDMVLLLDHGLIAEYDSPTSLLENKSSSFAQLVAEYTQRSNSSFEKFN
ncbi:hypothetical protein L1049_022962 [Liquidambar formosana]|uniref:ABC-type xenobiotic transporter n=1 Tax=Liquidambar formosana TaxID=63359 RepID=A0AAP0WSH5_LIQFO